MLSMQLGVLALHAENISNTQAALKLLGYSPGVIDGLYGKKTEIALQNYYKDKGRVYDGLLSDNEYDEILNEELFPKKRYVDNKWTFKSAEVLVGEAEPKDAAANMLSFEDIKKHNLNILNIDFDCGYTKEYIKNGKDTNGKRWDANKQKRLLDGLKYSCYLPQIDTFWTNIPEDFQADTLEIYTKYAKNLGLKVMAKPMVLRHENVYGLEKMPENVFWKGNEKFAGYENLILAVARDSERLGIEYLSIGTELTNLSRNILRSKEWPKLIAEIRKIYSGKLIYSHNVGPSNSLKELEYFTKTLKQLDYIGINFFPSPLMNGKKNYTSKQVASAMRKAEIGGKNIIKTMEKVAALTGKKVLLTETSFPSWKGAADHMFSQTCNGKNKGKSEWVYTKGPLQPKKPDWSEPLKIATAWYTVFAKQDWIEGVNYTFWTGSAGRRVEEIFQDTLYTRSLKNRYKKKAKAADDYMCNNFVWDKVTGIKEFIRDIHHEK